MFRPRSRSTSPILGDPSHSRRRKPKRLAVQIERCCCRALSVFPLFLVAGLTTWSLLTQTLIAYRSTKYEGRMVSGSVLGALAWALYLMGNWSYFVAVFTDAGRPSDLLPPSQSERLSQNGGPSSGPRIATNGGSYASLDDTHSIHSHTSITTKSTGIPRYCKKCAAPKPDRAHHCSTCARCVLKMDHHCPWLGTCVGLRNYKPFLLFLIYVTIFCWISFAASISWAIREIGHSARGGPVFGGGNRGWEDGGMPAWVPVNFIVLTVVAGIFGLALTGFTGWHLSLAARNMTTIECLEKTRYLAPVRRGLAVARKGGGHAAPGSGEGAEASIGQQLAEIHANALPGVLRDEEGDTPSSESVGDGYARNPPHPAYEGSPATASLSANLAQSPADYEASRASRQYEAYLDEKYNETLPHAFDLGWRRNLTMLFGASVVDWLIPIDHGTVGLGDGWRWEVSENWRRAKERAEWEKERELMANGGSGQRNLRYGSWPGDVGRLGEIAEEDEEDEEDEENERAPLKKGSSDSGGGWRSKLDENGKNGGRRGSDVSLTTMYGR